MIDDQDLLRHLREGGDELYERPEPPKLDLAAITGAAASGDRATTPASAPPRRTDRRWPGPLVLAGGALACIALGMVSGAALFGGDSPARQVVATTPSTPESTLPARRRDVSLARFDKAAPLDAAADASVFTATDGRTIELRVRGLKQPRKGEFYELWVLGNDGRMVSLGIVRVDASGSAEVRLPLPVSLRRFPVIDLSLESGDGDPTHSGHSILRSADVA